MGLKNSWTRRDEAALKEMLGRKQAFLDEAKVPLADLVFKYNLRSADRNATDVLIANADALRDALMPFDSGVRCGSGE